MKENIKKNAALIAIIAIVAILPTIVAVSFYSYAKSHPITRTSVSQMKVSTPDGTVYDYLKTDGGDLEDLYSLVFDMNENAVRADGLKDTAQEYICYVAEYTSYNKKNIYNYYLSENPDNVYFKNQKGDYYKVNPAQAGKFLSSTYASQLFPNASQPILLVADKTEVLPETMSWKYMTHDGTFIDSASDLAKGVEKINCSGGLQLGFSVAPDAVYVNLADTEGNTVYDGYYDDLGTELFVDNNVYTAKITAKWYESDGRRYYGEGTYTYIANVLSPAVFYVSATECEYGDFIIVSAKNVLEEEIDNIGFVSEPKIYGPEYDKDSPNSGLFKPQFFSYGGYVHAIIPFSIATCTANNNAADQYHMTFSYGDSYQEINVNVSPRNIKTAYLNSSIEKINTYLTEATLSTYKNVITPYLESKCPDFYWTGDNMLIQPIEGRSVKYGFAVKCIPNNKTSAWYWNEGVDFKAGANDEALACLPGKIIYVGETTYSGTMVIIEHGCGLKSLYSHLSATSVKVGDTVSKGEVIGIVGSTGFVDTRMLHFGLYVFDVPVRYYDYEENGIRVSEEIAEAIGLGTVTDE